MEKPLLIATIAVWALAFGLFVYSCWRYSRKPPEPSREKSADKPQPPRPPEDKN